jgi:antitoxin component of MazEF toxin-antitoxin module
MARKSRNVVRKGELVTGIRKIVKVGNGWYVNLPKEFLERHGLEEGDEVIIAANHLFKVLPMQER